MASAFTVESSNIYFFFSKSNKKKETSISKKKQNNRTVLQKKDGLSEKAQVLEGFEKKSTPEKFWFQTHLAGLSLLVSLEPRRSFPRYSEPWLENTQVTRYL